MKLLPFLNERLAKPTNNVKPAPSFNSMESIERIISSDLDVAGTRTADLTSNEEESSTTVQFRAFIPASDMPLGSRKEESTQSSDEESKCVELMNVACFILDQSKHAPEEVGSREEIVHR